MKKAYQITKFSLFITMLIGLASCSYPVRKANVKIITHEPPNIKEPTRWEGDCNNTLCKSLLDTINSAKNKLDIAVYGIGEQPEISQALLKALNRGVEIRLVYDQPLNGENYYAIEQNVDEKILQYAVHDNSDAIMHNNFVIADQCQIWTGSTDISTMGTGGYSANMVALIDSCYLGEIYEKEFSQLYSGKFQDQKKQVRSRKTELETGGHIQTFFSPKSDTLNQVIIPLLESAEESINIPISYLTHEKIFEVLKKAQSKGVIVQIILDAIGTEDAYVLDNELRSAKIPTKVENWGGKMHMKVAIIDNKHLIGGSMNFTQAGSSENDENTFILWDVPEIAQQANNSFTKMWNSIPDKYLYKSLKAENEYSINSCFDRIDNDFDEIVDVKDPDCFKPVLYASGKGSDIKRIDKTRENEELKADLFVSPTGLDSRKQSNITSQINDKKNNIKNNNITIFVSPNGNNKNLGSQEEPLRSLTEAVKKAKRRQVNNPDEEVTIKLDKGTYSKKSRESQVIQVGSGINILGSGESTILLANLIINPGVYLNNFQVKDHDVRIDDSEANNQDNAILEKLLFINGSIQINSSNAYLSDIELRDLSGRSSSLNITTGNPSFENIRIQNNSHAKSYTPYSGLSALRIGRSAFPQFKRLTIENNVLGIYNQGNLTIESLELLGNTAGVLNGGEIMIENLILDKPEKSHYGICNSSKGTILIKKTNFNNTNLVKSESCQDSPGDSFPDLVPDIAGNYQDVLIED